MASRKRFDSSKRSSSSENRSSSEKAAEEGANAIVGSRNRASRRFLLSEPLRSPDTVWRKVMKEGKTARNLVTWSVPVSSEEMEVAEKPGSGLHITSGDRAAVKPRLKYEDLAAKRKTGERRRKLTKKDLKALCWSYLFDSLHRAIDGIYTTCEMDESVVECEEVIMTLDSFRRDFKALIDRIYLQKAFEKADENSKPTSLAWEVRKRASPAKANVPSADQGQMKWADLFKPKKEETADRIQKETVLKQKKTPEKSAKNEPKITRKEKTDTIQKKYKERQAERKTSCVQEEKQNGVTLAQTSANNGGDSDEAGDEWQTVKVRKGVRRRLESAESFQPERKEIEKERTKAKEIGLVLSLDDLSSSSDDDLIPLPSSDTEKELDDDDDMEDADRLSVTSNEEEDDVNMSQNWSEILSTYEGDEAYRETNTWADRCESPHEIRSPGRAVHLHQKLSSSSRKRDSSKTKKMLEDKQAKAQLKRERIQEIKAEKLRNRTKKLQEVRESNDEHLRRLKAIQEQKQLRAEQLRTSKLQEIVRKAQEEEMKVSEISFINTLEAQNKKMEYEEKTLGHEARLQNLEEERQRKREEQQAKEEAAQERRRQLETERVARLEEVSQKKREQQAKLEQTRLEREEAVKEKARERERRREALALAHQLSVEELGRKVHAKHSVRIRKHDFQLVRRKVGAAAGGGFHSRHSSCDDMRSFSSDDSRTATPELSASLPANLFRRYASPAFSSGQSPGQKSSTTATALPDLAHEKLVKRTRHLAAVKETESLRDPERVKAMKKRAKKLRQRMNARARTYETNQVGGSGQDSPNKTKIQKAIKEVTKLLQGCDDKKTRLKAIVSPLDKALGVLRHCLEPTNPGDQTSFRTFAGFPTIARLLVLLDGSDVFHQKTLCVASLVLSLACQRSPANSTYVFLSNKVGPVVELLSSHLGRIDEEVVAVALMDFLVVVLENLVPSVAVANVGQCRLDFVSYVVCCGVVDGLYGVLNDVQKPVGDPSEAERRAETSLKFLVGVSDLARDNDGPFAKKAVQDPTQLAEALKATELLGIPSLLYALLLHAGAPRYGSVPAEIHPSVVGLAALAMSLINSVARFDLKMVQSCLSSEGIWSEFRLVAGHILWYCSHHKCELLLHETIRVIGYFAAANPSNQARLQSGRSPTLLQMLCALPFQYFSDPKLTSVLFPSLIAAACGSPANKAILEQEMSCVLLAKFIQKRELNRASQCVDSAAPFTADSFCVRFPVDEWERAAEFFRST